MDWTEEEGDNLQAVYKWESGGRYALSEERRKLLRLSYECGGWVAMRRGKIYIDIGTGASLSTMKEWKESWRKHGEANAIGPSAKVIVPFGRICETSIDTLSLQDHYDLRIFHHLKD